MIILQGNKIERSFSGDVLFDNINIQVDEKDRIALVGRNGAGKSFGIPPLTAVLHRTFLFCGKPWSAMRCNTKPPHLSYKRMRLQDYCSRLKKFFGSSAAGITGPVPVPGSGSP